MDVYDRQEILPILAYHLFYLFELSSLFSIDWSSPLDVFVRLLVEPSCHTNVVHVIYVIFHDFQSRIFDWQDTRGSRGTKKSMGMKMISTDLLHMFVGFGHLRIVILRTFSRHFVFFQTRNSFHNSRLSLTITTWQWTIITDCISSGTYKSISRLKSLSANVSSSLMGMSVSLTTNGALVQSRRSAHGRSRYISAYFAFNTS